MKFRKIAIIAVACLRASLAFGQANNSSNWQTPGNQIVPGVVEMCVTGGNAAVPCSAATPLPVTQGTIAAGTAGAGYPPGATPVSNAATGTTAGATATLPAAAGKFTYICGFSVSPGSATTAITINVVMTAAGTFTFSVGAPVTAVGTTGANIIHPITPCIPGSAVNTTVTVAAGALGAGGVNQDVNAWGFQQ